MIRFLRKPVFNQVKSILNPLQQQPILYYKPINYFSEGQKQTSNKDGSSKYKDEFNELKSKINTNKTQEELKQKAKEETINELKEKVSSSFKSGEKPTEESNKSTQGAGEQNKATDNASGNTTENANSQSQSTDQANGQAGAQTNPREAQPKKPSLVERLSEKSPIFGKVANYVAESWEETFPKSRFQTKTAEIKRKIKEEKEKQAQAVEYTEEELAKMQESIPEHRRTAVANFEGEVEEKSRAELIKERIKQKLLQTEAAQHLLKSEEYKEYQEFRKEMKQFKEDLKDNLSQSQNRGVILGMAALDKVTSESNTAQAIKEMRRYDKTFDIFDLEMDSKEIFLDVYNAFLQGNMEYLEKVCSDMALAYFKVLLKKREVDGTYPKYDRLWEIENAQLIGGKIPEKSLPCFTFTITTQEIQCNISKKENKIVDGADDRVVQASYNFVLKLHDSPDLETVGHRWALVEIHQLGAVQQLV